MHIILELLLLVGIIIYSYLESLVKFFIPRRRKSVAGQTVLITGAGHGIGRLTAYEFAKRKSRLVLWDINKRGVEETAAECRKLGAIVHVFVVDCSNRMEIYNSVDQVKKEVGDIEIVVNNAGAIYPADLLSTKDEEITKTFEVNILGHFWCNIRVVLNLRVELNCRSKLENSGDRRGEALNQVQLDNEQVNGQQVQINKRQMDKLMAIGQIYNGDKLS
ncbi:hypothetical protein A6R68_11019 [Neotoma lepida]|uniref:Uncharacterized protein n=1 Tax=Neotoma lepida TaxID=56216 RepID=A0A1A6FV75_NEOLE|nr:hypothetical protein A6R68_11019 [Neotoma lepida]